MINMTDDTIQFPPSIMNDRIKNLESQCWETQQLTADAHSWHTSFNSQKFAKLIIQDCISQIAMIGVSNCDDSDVVWTVDKSIENIRKHFGVEK